MQYYLIEIIQCVVVPIISVIVKGQVNEYIQYPLLYQNLLGENSMLFYFRMLQT